MISPEMQKAILGPVRRLCWLFWFEGSDTDLYAWTGDHKIHWNGQDYAGAGRLLSMSSQRKPDALQHVEHTFKLNGLSPSPLADLDDSVRGRGGKVWFAALNERGQIIPDPVLLTQIVQDTLKFERNEDDTVALTLTGYEALPFLGRVKGDKYSHEKWLADYGDEGFYYTAPIAASGRAVEWRP